MHAIQLTINYAVLLVQWYCTVLLEENQEQIKLYS